MFGKKDPACTGRLTADLAKSAPTVPLVEAGSLEADRIKHRRDTTTPSPLLFEGMQDLCSQTRAPMFGRKVEKLKEKQSQ